MLQRENECIVITGEYGVGKTVAGVTRYPPSKMNRGFVHDSEGSLNDVLYNLAGSDLKPGHYVDTRERFPELKTEEILERMGTGIDLPWVDKNQWFAMVQYFKFVMGDIAENLTKGDFDWFLFDTIEKFESGLVSWSESEKGLSGYKTDKGGQKWLCAVYPFYETLFKTIWSMGVKSIIITSHLKSVSDGRRPIPGKFRMSGKPLLYVLATSMFWLVKDPTNPRGEPAALVLKSRYGDLGADLVADSWNPKRLLPPRIPRFTWAEVERYIQTKCYDPLNPLPGEVLSEKELSLVTPILSGKQLDLMIEEAKLERTQIESRSISMPGARTISASPEPDVKVVTRIGELKSEGYEDTEITEILRSEGMRKPVILRALKSVNEKEG